VGEIIIIRRHKNRCWQTVTYRRMQSWLSQFPYKPSPDKSQFVVRLIGWVNGEPRRKVTPTLSRSPLLGSLPLTIAEIPPERRAIQKLAAFSGFVPTNALAPTIRCGPRGSGFAGALPTCRY
jgi:hypothetical protein